VASPRSWVPDLPSLHSTIYSRDCPTKPGTKRWSTWNLGKSYLFFTLKCVSSVTVTGCRG